MSTTDICQPADRDLGSPRPGRNPQPGRALRRGPASPTRGGAVPRFHQHGRLADAAGAGRDARDLRRSPPLGSPHRGDRRTDGHDPPARRRRDPRRRRPDPGASQGAPGGALPGDSCRNRRGLSGPSLVGDVQPGTPGGHVPGRDPPNARRPPVGLVRPSTEPIDLAQPLWPVVRSAADLLTGSSLERVKRCPGEGCGWLFLDTSRNGSRRWCDMSSCGNRARVRAFAARQRESCPLTPRPQTALTPALTGHPSPPEGGSAST